MRVESDLYLEPFLKEHKKNSSYKQAYDFKTKMYGSLKAQRTSLVMLFKLLDRLVGVKQQVGDTMDKSLTCVCNFSMKYKVTAVLFHVKSIIHLPFYLH